MRSADERLADQRSNRSINLALSVRGLTALHSTGRGLDAAALQIAIPMRGRMLHDAEGRLTHQSYGIFGEVNYLAILT
jgi:kynurenine 3-monooxygenase